MVFNETLWSIHSKVVDKSQKEGLNDILPSSIKVFLVHFHQIINDYRTVQEFVATINPPHRKPDQNSSLYLKMFCNGVSSVLQIINEKLASIEESLLSDESILVLVIFNQFVYLSDILRNLNVAVQQVKEEKYHGCRVLDLCGNFIHKESPAVRDVFMKIQQFCVKQLYVQTKLWIMQMELYDPYNEFFIKLSQDSTVDSNINQSVSSQYTTSSRSSQSDSFKFEVNIENLPSLIPFSVATKMLFIGEALIMCQHNEIDYENKDRLLHSCGISEHKISSRFAEIEKSQRFSLQKFSSLIDDLWMGVNKYIHKMSDEVGNVQQQLWLMWEMYLLGRGEVFQEFLLKASTILNSDVTNVDSRNLNMTLRDCLYYVYLTENSDIMNQFFFKLPCRKTLSKGSPTWAFLRLECKIKWPLHYLFTREVLKNYNYLFHFLLKLKKAERDVAPTWKMIDSLEGHKMELIEVRIHLLAVVGNLINYSFTNVIAKQMDDLMIAVNKAVMFTDLQRALSTFLLNVSNGLFLPELIQSSESRFDTNSTASLPQDTMNRKVYRCFRTIFSLCEEFPKLLDGKNDEHFETNIAAFKTKFDATFKKLFSLLNKMDEQYYTNSESTHNLHSLTMCLDYNKFFRNKFLSSN